MKQKQTLTPEARLAAAQLPREAWPYALPAGWQWVRLGDIYDINPKNKAADDTEASFITMSDIEAGMVSVYQTTEKPWGDIKRGHTHFADGDVAFAKISPCLENRKSMVLHDLKNGIGAGTTELIVLRSQFVDKYYTFWLVNSEDFIRRCVATYSGTVGQQRVSMDFVKNYPVPLPPFSEQRRLVQRIEGLFARLDAAAAKITAASDAAARRKAAILHAAFTGQLTEQWRESAGREGAAPASAEASAAMAQLAAKQLPREAWPYDLPDGWLCVRLGDAYEVNPKIKADDAMEASFITMSDIDAGFVSNYRTTEKPWGAIRRGHTQFADGDVAFAKISPCLENRKSMILQGLKNGIGAGTTELIILRSLYIDRQFTFWLISSEEFIRGCVATYSGTVGQQRVSMDFVKNYPVPIPPLPEQREIVRRLDALLAREARASAAIERARTELQRLRTAILARAFRGEL